MNKVDYDQLFVDCPSLRLKNVTLRTVEREVQQVWGTNDPIDFVLYRGSGGRPTVTDSVPNWPLN